MRRPFIKTGHSFADLKLSKISRKAYPITWPLRYSKYVNRDLPQITYGYTGLVARNIIRSSYSHDTASVLANLYVLDHPFVPPVLMSSCFRITRVDPKRLRTMEIDPNIRLPATVRNAIYSYLKDIQSLKRLYLTGRPSSNLDPSRPIFLNILASPSLKQLSRYLQPCKFSNNSGIGILGKSQEFIVFKQRTATFRDDGSAVYRDRNSSSVTLDVSHISSAYCATSLLAYRLILMGIETSLSLIHPSSTLLPLRIPSMTPDDSIELIYDIICRTTVHISQLRSLV